MFLNYKRFLRILVAVKNPCIVTSVLKCSFRILNRVETIKGKKVSNKGGFMFKTEIKKYEPTSCHSSYPTQRQDN